MWHLLYERLPELWRLIVEDYATQDIKWQSILGERVFPCLTRYQETIPIIGSALAEQIPAIFHQAATIAEVSDTLFVIYVGLGNGAGWQTTLLGKPAVLFGVEGIAESGWVDARTLGPLIAHEIGHVVQHQWREGLSVTQDSGPYWQLFEEGFAQLLEHSIMGRDTWHESSTQPGWVDWCTNNRGLLARRFLGLVDSGKTVRSLFGSWYDVCGYRQCGYFLGHEVVKCMSRTVSLKRLATMGADQFADEAREILQAWAHEH